MTARRWLLLAVLIGVAWLALPRRPQNGNAPAPAPRATSSSPLASSETVAVPRPAARRETPPPKPLELPTKPDFAREVLEDPHGPVKSLLMFAQDLGEKMDSALRDEAAATRLFPDLESCVASVTAPLSARALCLHNARRLGEKYASLWDSYRDLQSSASDEVRKLTRAVEPAR